MKCDLENSFLLVYLSGFMFFFTSLFITSYISIFAIVSSQHSLIPHSHSQTTIQSKTTTFLFEKAQGKNNFSRKFYSERIPRLWGKKYQEEPSCPILSTCLRKNINQFKVNLKSIYQYLVETTFDTNNYFRPTLVS